MSLKCRRHRHTIPVNGAAIACLVLLPTTVLAKSTPLTQARIETGRLQGATGKDAAIGVFKAIPYAASPVGDLRFRPPAAATPWNGLRDATQFGPACPQESGMATRIGISEDCLTLNIWTGAATRKERRPVLVWFYGGGFNGGDAADPAFDGEALARKGVIVVTVNYRLGPLGFLATPELDAEMAKTGGASGNFGLMDDIAALKWVKRNVEAFGGDPTKVTIAGQSAGAGTVQFLTNSPLARGLFRAGIGESQVRHPGDLELRYLNVSWRAKPDALAAGQKFMADKGAKSLADLRALPWQELIRGTNVPDQPIYTGTRSRPPLFRPVIEGYVLPRSYSQTFATGTMNHITYIAGNNKDESGAVPETAFPVLRTRPPLTRAGAPTTVLTLDDYTAWAKGKFGAMADEFLQLYPAASDDEAALQNNEAARDNGRISTWLWARERARWVKLPMYTYFWNHALTGPSKTLRGAFHGSELNYVFDSLHATALPWTPDDRHIADVMSSYWANITKNGNPNGPGLPHWPAYSTTLPQVMVVGDSFGPQTIATPAKRAFWERFFKAQEQW